MANVQIKSETIATYGGISHVMDVFERLGLGRLIDSSLGKRDASWNAFRYSEVTETLFCNYLCGGDCLEDINMLAPQLALRPGTRIPNSDTVGRVLKSLRQHLRLTRELHPPRLPALNHPPHSQRYVTFIHLRPTKSRRTEATSSCRAFLPSVGRE